MPLTLIVAFAVAMLLNARVRGLAIFRVIYYLPAIVPVVANAMLWMWLFNPDFGLLNSATALGRAAAVGLGLRREYGDPVADLDVASGASATSR